MTQPPVPSQASVLASITNMLEGLPRVPGLNVVDEIMRRVQGMQLGDIWRGTVTGTSGNLVTVRRSDQAAADAQSYARLSSYTGPANGDEVIVQRVGTGWIVMGKVLR